MESKKRKKSFALKAAEMRTAPSGNQLEKDSINGGARLIFASYINQHIINCDSKSIDELFPALEPQPTLKS
jgi:hypothetical protein